MKKTISTLMGASVLTFGMAISAGQATAANLDLTQNTNGTGGFLGDAYFVRTDIPAAGSGNWIEPFLRLQREGNSSSPGQTELGVNTDANNAGQGLQFDTKPGAWTHSIKLSDIPTVTVGDGVNTVQTTYRLFVLDWNEPNGKNDPVGDNLIDLTTFKLFTSTPTASNPNPAYPTYSISTGLLNGSISPFYNLDALADNTVNGKDINSGSGAADLLVYIPNSYFANIASNTNIVLVSGFDKVAGGFEEWGYCKDSTKFKCSDITQLPPTNPVPEPLTMLGAGAAVAFGGAFKRKLAQAKKNDKKA